MHSLNLGFLTPLQLFLGILNYELPVEKSNEVKPKILKIFLPFLVLDLREQTWLSLNAISLYHFHWLRNDLTSQETQGLGSTLPCLWLCLLQSTAVQTPSEHVTTDSVSISIQNLSGSTRSRDGVPQGCVNTCLDLAFFRKMTQLQEVLDLNNQGISEAVSGFMVYIRSFLE